MTNDELERVMNFIIERQERFSEELREQQELSRELHENNRELQNTARQLQETTHEQQELARVLLDTQAALTESVHGLLAKGSEQDNRLAEHNERIARFERSYIAIADLLRAHDQQITSLTENGNDTNAAVTALTIVVERTTATVERVTTKVEQTNAAVERLSTTVERYIAARGDGDGKA